MEAVNTVQMCIEGGKLLRFTGKWCYEENKKMSCFVLFSSTAWQSPSPPSGNNREALSLEKTEPKRRIPYKKKHARILNELGPFCIQCIRKISIHL